MATEPQPAAGSSSRVTCTSCASVCACTCVLLLLRNAASTNERASQRVSEHLSDRVGTIGMRTRGRSLFLACCCLLGRSVGRSVAAGRRVLAPDSERESRSCQHHLRLARNLVTSSFVASPAKSRSLKVLDVSQRVSWNVALPSRSSVASSSPKSPKSSSSPSLCFAATSSCFLLSSFPCVLARSPSALTWQVRPLQRSLTSAIVTHRHRLLPKARRTSQTPGASE